MKTKISTVLLLVSLALLIIYGADVLVSKKVSNDLTTGKLSAVETSSSSSGFLKMNESIRGGLIGGGAVVLSVVAFAISLRQKSGIIVLLLFINGILIVVGMAALYIENLQHAAVKGQYGTVFGTMALGFLLVALGIIKTMVTRTPTTVRSK